MRLFSFGGILIATLPRDITLGYQDWLGQSGTINIPVVWSVFILETTLLIMLKGGNIKYETLFHSILKASIAHASGSGCQLTYRSIGLQINQYPGSTILR